MYHSAPDNHPPGRTRMRRRWALALGIGMAALVATPGTTGAQTDGEQTPAEQTNGEQTNGEQTNGEQTNGEQTPDAYVTTTTTPERSLDVSAFSPECIRDAPFINYTIVPVGFTPVDGSATLVIRAANGTIVDTRQVTSLSGQFIWPGASVDAAGNATDWPGWQRAADGVSWIPDPSDAFLREGLSIEVTVNPTATATVSYPPATSACANPPETGLDVSAFAPVCIADAPFIEYDIRTVNFSSNGPATLRFFDRNGTFVEERTVTTLSGRTVYPGASVDADGTPTDWPGWKLADDGVSWIPDESDAILRQGLTIEVTVNPTATATVTYPPATALCANPPSDERVCEPGDPLCDPPCVPGQNNDGNPNDDCDPVCVPGQNNDGNPADDCDPVCVPGQNNDGNPADDCDPVCVPGQNNDANPADDCELPTTGGGPGNLLLVGAAALLGGLLLFTSARRRGGLAPPAG